jgi:D-lactate dehydrogenase (cytochrome)
VTNNQFNPVTNEFVAALESCAGAEQVSVAQAERRLHARDMSAHPEHLPDVVVWPQTAEQAAAVLRLANEAHVPVTPWGVGSSLEGNPVPRYGGVVLSLARMNRITAVHAGDFQATVEPGIAYKDLNHQLAVHGLFFAPDPGANATIGGMLANNAAGIRTVKYGASKDNVLRLQVALADGRLIRVGSRSVKQASGYDLLHLFVGSEGTLGVITEATLKLWPIPELMSAVVASFETVAAAVETVVLVRGSGLEPAALEFIDAAHARMLSQAEGVDLGERPVLFMEFHAAQEAALQMGLDAVRQICREMGAVTFRATTDAEERRRLWRARHAAYEIALRTHPQEKFMILDVAVPISAFPAMVAHIETILASHNLAGYMIGHAGDGNLHVLLPFRDDASHRVATAVNEAAVLKALELEGTATGEHGVGFGKARFMAREHGPALAVMKALKQTLDPNGILNPGKIFTGSVRRPARAL